MFEGISKIIKGLMKREHTIEVKMDQDKKVKTLIDRLCKYYDVDKNNEAMRKALILSSLKKKCIEKGIDVGLTEWR